jgi:GTPase SAR1 family protein
MSVAANPKTFFVYNFLAITFNVMKQIKLRCAVIGEPSVGKSSLVKSYLFPSIARDIPSTNTLEKHSIKLSQKGNAILFDLFDSGTNLHQQVFTTIGGSVQDVTKFYPQADCFLICFDIAEPKTFNIISKKVNHFQPQLKTTVPRSNKTTSTKCRNSLGRLQIRSS